MRAFTQFMPSVKPTKSPKKLNTKRMMKPKRAFNSSLNASFIGAADDLEQEYNDRNYGGGHEYA